ncbi:MAG: gliding motility-associated C-terminal domain-containing protein [Bacteroidota bacterium]
MNSLRGILLKASILCCLLLSVGIINSQEILISQGGTVNNCGGSIVDAGGSAGPYGDFEFFQTTICSDVPGQCLSLEFTTFETLLNSDFLFIYDGPSTADPLIDPAGFHGNLGAFTVEASGDCLTLLWFSGLNSGALPGFEANIICANCPSCTDGIQNGSETGIDCGGSVCDPCPCEDFLVDAFPYTDNNSTCGLGDDYNSNDACFSFFMNGEDAVYLYTPTSSACLEITLEYPNNPGAAGLSIMDGCPDWITTSCVSNNQSLFGATSISANINAIAGQDYYIVVSSDEFQTNCLDYTLTIDEGVPTNQDCLGAEPICDLFVDVPNSLTGTGACIDFTIDNPSCFTTDELNSMWFTFGTANPGNLSFVLNPNDPDDDFDWALFNITGVQCSEILDDPSTLVSCNTYGQVGGNGATGISTALGGFGNSNGPGNTNGPAFNADLAVQANETYVLMISNWSGTFNGYSLDFSSSDQGIFGFAAPDLNEAISSAFCSLANGEIDLTAISGGLPPYEASMNGIVENDLIFSDLLPGDYDIEIVTGSQCSFSYNLVVGDNAITTDAGDDISECDLVANLIGEELAGFTGTWSGPVDISFDNANNSNVEATSQAGGVFTMTWTIDNGDGCVISDDVDVIFTDEIIIQVDEFEESCYQYCDGAAHAFPSGGSGSITYDYFFSGGTAGTLTNEVELLCPGAYEVTVIDENGCAETQAFNIIAADVFEIMDIISINQTCPGDCDGQLMVNAPTATSLSADGGLSFVGDTVVGNLCPGEYNLIAMNDENCLTPLAIGSVGVNDPPIANFDIEPSEASVFDANFSVTDESEGGEGDLQYDWFFGFEGQSNLQNPHYTFLNADPGEYSITLLLTDSLGCQDTLVKFINIIEDFHIFAPNSFTPDGDGVNEYFYVVGSDIDDRNFEMEIYDRFGHTVFFTNDPEDRWDGSDEGNEYFVNVSVYNWRIKTKRLSSFDEVEMFGQVTLIR